MNLKDPDYVKALKSNLHATFDSPQGKESMRFIEKIGGWTPTVLDSSETNEVIARDANRRLIGTLKTIMECSVDQILALTKEV